MTVENMAIGNQITYSGEVKCINGKNEPDGFGVCKYPDHVDKGWYKNGRLEGLVYMNYHDWMRIGRVNNGVFNGWGMYVNRGTIEFGIYKNTQLIIDLTPLVEVFWNDILESLRWTNINAVKVHDYGVIFVGAPLGYTNSDSFLRGNFGFHFLNSGQVYLGVCDYGYDARVGMFIHFDSEYHISKGKYCLDILERDIDDEEFFAACKIDDPEAIYDFRMKYQYYHKVLSVFRSINK